MQTNTSPAKEFLFYRFRNMGPAVARGYNVFQPLASANLFSLKPIGAIANWAVAQIEAVITGSAAKFNGSSKETATFCYLIKLNFHIWYVLFE